MSLLARTALVTTGRRTARVLSSSGLSPTRLPLLPLVTTALCAAAVSSLPWIAAVVLPSRSLTTTATRFSLRTGPSSAHTPGASFAAAAYTTREVGERGTKDWRLYVQLNGKDVSLWHDIPLLARGSSGQQLYFNYVNEIPKHTRPKYEIATRERGTPIKQDVKKDKLRVFTYGDLPFNYGCLPQTWENPHEPHALTKLNGDNDPIDVVELSNAPIPVGDVRAVKILGVLALFDENETDWKLLAIDASHPHAEKIASVEDIEKYFPGRMHEVREWFRHYKTSDGKPQNAFGFEEKVMDRNLAMKVIWETHAAWGALVRGELPRSDLWLLDEVPKAALDEHEVNVEK